ncbi:M15 family metallopeptidase [Caulobacter sp. 17J65-9]|uniref:M15 family metallopeptidase n=1 Tax=Caulobacter sp. 17J65-9 TaxID=2709382 RepID=UPI0013CC3D52|nr:M15 family metallopeptidase [Caulobacter sp. 17J65-9]NEX91405.1 M15 family metallopeptidase [Caulobacter sp. 17J65-9]
MTRLGAAVLAVLLAADSGACAPLGPVAPGAPIAAMASVSVPAVTRKYASCGDAEVRFREAARHNAEKLDTLVWAPFGVEEHGWEAYAPLMAHEIGTTCGFGTPAFAQALATWQLRYNLPGDGEFGPDTFEVLKGVLQERRPFVMARLNGECPEGPTPVQLTTIPTNEETFAREGRQLRPEVLSAWRRMVDAARAEVPAIRNDPTALTLFSGYRDPASDEARCTAEGNCDGARRAACSPHRTGTAVDVNVGWVEGQTADSVTFENRLHQTRSPAYRWMVENAHRFGFVNYVFEPWHWEWVGPSADTVTAAASPPP